MVYFVEEAILLRYIIYELLGGLAATTALEADFLIEGKFEETPEDNAENKHLIDEKRTPQCRKHAGLCQSDRYEKGCGNIVIVSYVQFVNAVDIEL